MVGKQCIRINRLSKEAKNIDVRSKQKYCMANIIGQAKNRIENPNAMRITNIFKEKAGWRNAHDFFSNNGTDNRMYRMPSPDKITSNIY